MRPRRAPGRTVWLPLLVAAAAGVVRADFGKEEARFPNESYPVEFRKRVNAAIDRAAHGLLSRQRADGAWDDPRNARYPMGPTALATLAVLKAGVPADHPRVVRAFAFLRGLPFEATYSTALLLMALDAKYDDSEDGFAPQATDRYGNRVVKSPCAERIPKEELEWTKA